MCTAARACKKETPKPFRAETGHSDNNYYIVSRLRSPRDGGVSVESEVRARLGAQMVTISSLWAVPHSLSLLCMFLCCINVELCVSPIGGIEYLFKYVCKSLDRVTAKIAPDGER